METLNILKTKLNLSEATLKKYLEVIKKIENTSFATNSRSSKEEIKIDMDVYYSGGYDNLKESVEWMLKDIINKYMRSKARRALLSLSFYSYNTAADKRNDKPNRNGENIYVSRSLKIKYFKHSFSPFLKAPLLF